MIMKSLAARSATWVLPSLNSITLSGRQSNYGSYRCTFQPLLGVKLPGASGFCINSGMLQSWGNPMNRAIVIGAAVVLTSLMPSNLVGCGPKGHEMVASLAQTRLSGSHSCFLTPVPPQV